ncbi:MAG: hypothetical protein HOW73_13215 [Polyangiaceae bacterium]|nr:hypothetical protein [Polyangiaceae bacterium]
MTRFVRFSFLPLLLSSAVTVGCGDSTTDDAGAGSQQGGGNTGGGDNGGGPSGGNGAGGGDDSACPSGSTLETSGVELNGTDEYISMGAAPELGLEQFTVEAWVRRDDIGQPAGTGVGGLQLVPIAGKGRGEDDGSNVDCNYAFGFFGDVLGADFEDMASGANHPITGTKAIPIGSWHHVAASYDGTTWRLYVDGELDASSAANATPRGDSIQHFGIGAAFDSAGTPAGRFNGAIDEVRVWDRARTDAEIADAMYDSIATAPNLVGRWALDEADAGAPDSVGTNPGTMTGGLFIHPAAPLDKGAPPEVSGAAPVDDVTVDGTSAELSIDVTDPENADSVVSFHVREIGEGNDFTLIVLPDTQYYTRVDDNHDFFYDQTQWIMDNKEAYNIVGVIHNGDIVDNGNIDSQWTVANQAMSTLEDPIGTFLDGMPYGVCAGNHDQSPNSATNSTEKFNIHFGVDRFTGRTYYGGHYADDNDENWVTFSAGGLDFVVVNLQYDTTPDAAVLEWARSIFLAHPEAFGILNTHYILGGGGNFGDQGAAIYEALKDVDNVQLMTCGHVAAESRRTDDFEGNVIHSMLADYQGRPDGGGGFLRIWEFSPANDEITVRSYSPTYDEWETDDNSEFTLPVELIGSGGDFAEKAVVDPAAGHVTATVDGLTAGRTYEWYATITDCAHTVETPIYRFKTAP